MRIRTGCLGVFTTIAVALASCQQGSLGFDIDRDIAEQTIPGNPVAHAGGMALDNLPVLDPFDLNIDLSAESQAAGVVVQHVRLSSLDFTITGTAQPAGDSDCFDFINEVHVYIESQQSGSSLLRREIATGGVAGCVTTYSLTPDTSVDLKPYIEQGARISATGSGVPPEDDVSFSGHVVLRASEN